MILIKYPNKHLNVQIPNLKGRNFFQREPINYGIIDSSFPEMVAGVGWLKAYESAMGKEYTNKERKDVFQFGNEIYKAEYFKMIPIKIGDYTEVIEVVIVETDIPLLFSETWLEKHKAKIDFEKKILYLDDINESIILKKTSNGHLSIAIEKNVEGDKDELVKNILLVQRKVLNKEELKKIHRKFGYPEHQEDAVREEDA